MEIEFETVKTIVWTVTGVACTFVVGWHIGDYVQFKRNLNRNNK